MSRELPKRNVKPDGYDDGDNDKRAYIQYRGAEASVVNDEYGLLFEVEDGKHVPLPVVAEDEDNPPRDGVIRPVAEDLVDRNPLIYFGVACETVTEDGVVPLCGKVFATPEELNGHQQAHRATNNENDNETEQENED